ncbi:MAG: hypothetical protein GX353_10305 [Oligella ureolytica]|nr:hypothetical protein [Oligella ureolytica]
MKNNVPSYQEFLRRHRDDLSPYNLGYNASFGHPLLELDESGYREFDKVVPKNVYKRYRSDPKFRDKLDSHFFRNVAQDVDRARLESLKGKSRAPALLTGLGAAAGLTAGVALASKFKGTAGEKAIAGALISPVGAMIGGIGDLARLEARKRLGMRKFKKRYGREPVQATPLYLEDILEPSDYASLLKKASLDYEQELRKRIVSKVNPDNSNLMDVYDSERRNIEAALSEPSVKRDIAKRNADAAADADKLFRLGDPRIFVGGTAAGAIGGGVLGAKAGHPLFGAGLGAFLGMTAGSSLEEALKQRRFKKRFGRAPTKKPQVSDYLE